MYAIVCGAIDDVIEPLADIPLAYAWVQVLRAALLQA